jgi:hypothetical protein
MSHNDNAEALLAIKLEVIDFKEKVGLQKVI